MGKFIKLFSTDSDRIEYEGGGEYIEPYVSYVNGDNSVHYNKVETKLVVYYDIQDISSPTTIWTNYEGGVVKSIEVDGTLLDSNLTTTYQFDTVGQHVIKYEFHHPTTVGNSAPIFYKLTTVKRVVIPNTFTAIGDNAFNGCSGLTSVTIGSGVTSIGDYAFNACFNLESVTIPNSVTSIGDTAFSACFNLESVTIPNSVTSIGNAAFSYCSGLTSVNIPDSVTTIGDYVFKFCSGLTSVTIGNGVTSIGSEAFRGCSNLISIASLAMVAPDIVGNTFQDVKTNGTLTVPSGSSGYDTSTNHWLYDGNYYLGYYNWTKVEQ